MTTDAHIGTRIARAQLMLGRLGQRRVYERSDAAEKVLDAARCCVEAAALLGVPFTDVEGIYLRALEDGEHVRAVTRAEG